MWQVSAGKQLKKKYVAYFHSFLLSRVGVRGYCRVEDTGTHNVFTNVQNIFNCKFGSLVHTTIQKEPIGIIHHMLQILIFLVPASLSQSRPSQQKYAELLRSAGG